MFEAFVGHDDDNSRTIRSNQILIGTTDEVEAWGIAMKYFGAEAKDIALIKVLVGPNKVFEL